MNLVFADDFSNQIIVATAHGNDTLGPTNLNTTHNPDKEAQTGVIYIGLFPIFNPWRPNLGCRVIQQQCKQPVTVWVAAAESMRSRTQSVPCKDLWERSLIA